jgi:hypothetical protein
MKKNIIIAAVVLILLIGAGVMYHQMSSRPSPAPMAVREDAGPEGQTASDQAAKAPQPFTLQGADQETVASPSSSGFAAGPVEHPSAATADGEAQQDRSPMKQADAGKSATGEASAQENGETEAAEQTATQTEDMVVTLGFIDDLCAYILERFFPPGISPAKDAPVSTLTFKGLNAHYGVDFDGLAHESSDPIVARKEVLDYVMSPLVVHALGRLYSDWFVECMVIAAENTGKTTAKSAGTKPHSLTQSEIGAMLRINADKLRSWSKVLAAVAAQPELQEQAGRYVRSANRVTAANAAFQQLLGALRQADGQKPEVENNPRVRKSAQTLKQAIAAREQAKQRILDIVRSDCGRDCPDNAEILAIVQWAHRRLIAQNNASAALQAAAEESASLAEKMQARGRKLRKISGEES